MRHCGRIITVVAVAALIAMIVGSQWNVSAQVAGGAFKISSCPDAQNCSVVRVNSNSGQVAVCNWRGDIGKAPVCSPWSNKLDGCPLNYVSRRHHAPMTFAAGKRSRAVASV